MGPLSFWIVWFAVLTDLSQADFVTQSISSDLRPEEGTVTLSCTYDTPQTGYVLNWYREHADRDLEFVVSRSTYGNQDKADFTEDRFSVEFQISEKYTSLTITGLQMSDAAVYYCAFRDYTYGHKDTASGAQSEVILSQPETETGIPGQSLKLTCKTNGFDLRSNYMYWYRQSPGNGLQLLVYYYNKDLKYFNPEFEQRVTASKDLANNIFTLEIRPLRISDSATYYSASSTVRQIK
ncbi:T cell receptor alpha chain MC.7.G5-like [Chiloscyllium plagiosum]|uniref:T cell receptor alpha chain MC.7.G5-like n=1 Tax=Chiloscyllium plagiosum TaxID=36176 RepID=UPI001CB7C7A3|nr:T cell receptor alpha chain MC.7.G5-like [Chiloscyllium plagiosum]